MLKYHKQAESLPIYSIPSSVGYEHRLDIGEWTFPVHSSVMNHVTSFHQLCRYGSIDPSFESLIHEIKQYTKVTTQDDCILITNGSDNALRLILELFATNTSTFLVPKPSYNNFELMLGTHTIQHVSTPHIDYTLTNDQVYSRIIQELNVPHDVVYIINPSMLIGHLLTTPQIEYMLQMNTHTLFIIDEAYIEFSNQESCAPLIEKYSNLIVVKTFSKFFSLASLRIGYLLTNKNILSLIKPYYNYRDVSPLAVQCALSTLQNIDFYKQNKQLYLDIRKYIIQKLNIIKMNNINIIDFIMNDGIYFIIICEDPMDLQHYLDKRGVSVRSKTSDLKGSVRITISTYGSMDRVFELLTLYRC